MNCDDVARNLSDALDGEGSAWRRLQIRLHLLLCPPCRAARSALKRTVDLLGALPDQPAGDMETDEEARDG